MSPHWEECISGIIKHKEGRMSAFTSIGCHGSVVTHVLSFISSEIKGIGVHFLCLGFILLLTFSFLSICPHHLPPFCPPPPGLSGSDLLHAWGDRWIASQQTGKTTGVSLRAWEFRCLCALLCKDVEVKMRGGKKGYQLICWLHSKWTNALRTGDGSSFFGGVCKKDDQTETKSAAKDGRQRMMGLIAGKQETHRDSVTGKRHRSDTQLEEGEKK